MKALLILIILGFSYGGIVEVLRENMKESDYVNSMVEMLELSMMQNSKVDQVVGILQDILGGLRTDQSTDDMEHSNRMAQWEKTIQNLENNLESLSAENQNNNRQLGAYSEEVVTLSSAVGTLSKQLTLLTTKEESLRETRANENATFLVTPPFHHPLEKAANQLQNTLRSGAAHHQTQPSHARKG